MGYICSLCKESFTRCAFIIHTTEKKCSSAAALKDSKQVSPNSFSTEHVQSNSTSKLEKVSNYYCFYYISVMYFYSLDIGYNKHE